MRALRQSKVREELVKILPSLLKLEWAFCFRYRDEEDEKKSWSCSRKEERKKESELLGADSQDEDQIKCSICSQAPLRPRSDQDGQGEERGGWVPVPSACFASLPYRSWGSSILHERARRGKSTSTSRIADRCEWMGFHVPRRGGRGHVASSRT